MAWLETVVCSSHKKIDARFLRTLNAHQELKRRQDGCLLAWAARSVDGQPLFLVQTLYKSRTHLKRISKIVAEKLDSEHGPLESFMSGPPLVGIFEVDEKRFLEQFKPQEKEWCFSSYNGSYATILQLRTHSARWILKTIVRSTLVCW